jgi:hypothetical protein
MHGGEDMIYSRWTQVLALACAGALVVGCSDSGGSEDVDTGDEVTRVQDTRSFAVNEAALAFDPPKSGIPTDRWTGVMDNGAGYRVEVPESNWNGILVMYAHGFRGNGPALTVSSAPLREYYISRGYAWAASSYSRNYYDVRVGVEDTNALANAFVQIAEDNERPLNRPDKIYITGDSMGGHITAAAIEAETMANANNKTSYAGAVPRCAVLGGEAEFDYLGNFTFAAQHAADLGPDSFPPQFDQAAIDAVLWNQPPPTFAEIENETDQPADPTAAGLVLQNIVQDLSGGARPAFVQGFRGPRYHTVMSLGGSDGTVTGILARNLFDNTKVQYDVDGNPDTVSDAEMMFNDSILRVNADPNANPPQPDGLRWIPRINGEISVPVVTLHNLGDMFVPFRHEQFYRKRVEANGNGDLVVQRAIRSSPHCDWRAAELIEAFQAMVDWEQNPGNPPAGDAVSRDAISDPDYGCQFTREQRDGIPACGA